MDARVLRCLALVAALGIATLPVRAESTLAACELPASESDPLADRAGILAQYERLPQPCLRAIFSACSSASDQAMLDFGTAAVCSFGYEALLKQGFGGSFRALMAWWHTQRTQAVQ